ncbi:MAG: S41 family peptidase [Armatimonadota bacterium]
MKFNIKQTANWFMIFVIVAIAFQAGSNLREKQYFHLPLKQSALQASALLKLTPEWDPVAVSQTKAADTEDRQLFRNVFNLLKAHYVDPVTPEMETAMARGAVKGMVESFGDPDNRFMDPTERKLLDDASNGRFYGIGAILTIKQEKTNKTGASTTAPSKTKPDQLDVIKIIVVSPMPGSPAEKAGLKAGDSITNIDGKWIITSDPFLMANLDSLSKAVRNKELDEFEYQKRFDDAEKKLKDGMEISTALEMLTARSSGEITVTVNRAGTKKPIEFKNVPCTETYSDPVVYRRLDSKVEYIKVSQFNKIAAAEFSRQISKTLKDDSKGLILDLRNNPGGLISSGVGIAGKIMGSGILGTVIETSRRRVIKITKSDKYTKPIVVLVNNGTASVAELVASSLGESGAAIIVGTKTFGDGLTQTPLTLKDGSAAIFTTGRMITSKGKDFNNKGIVPARIVLDSSTTEDKQLAEAQRILLAKSGKV